MYEFHNLVRKTYNHPPSSFVNLKSAKLMELFVCQWSKKKKNKNLITDQKHHCDSKYQTFIKIRLKGKKIDPNQHKMCRLRSTAVNLCRLTLINVNEGTYVLP